MNCVLGFVFGFYIMYNCNVIGYKDGSLYNGFSTYGMLDQDL